MGEKSSSRDNHQCEESNSVICVECLNNSEEPISQNVNKRWIELDDIGPYRHYRTLILTRV